MNLKGNCKIEVYNFIYFLNTLNRMAKFYHAYGERYPLIIPPAVKVIHKPRECHQYTCTKLTHRPAYYSHKQ